MPEGLLERVARRRKKATAYPDREAALLMGLRGSFNLNGIEGKALRGYIETMVEGAELSPSQAEAWARTFAWAPFAGWADPESYDPRGEEMWSLSMGAAWICWREESRQADSWLDDDHGRQEIDSWADRDHERGVDQVRRHWPAYIAASTRWIEISHSMAPGEDAPRTTGYIIAPRENRGWSPPPAKSCDAKQTLLDALKSGSLVAKRYTDGTLTPIQPAEWSILKLVGFHDEDGVHRVYAPGGSEYLSVCIPREQLEKLFPLSAHIDEPQTLTPVTVATAKKLLIEEATGRGGPILGKRSAEHYLRNIGFGGRGNIRVAVDELTGGRKPGKP